MRNWLLPEYIEDVLPAEAARMEQMRRALLDLFHTHGYQLVIPPMLEYVESLMSGAGEDLDLATFKVVDLLSGRLMGVRADITPQTARMDAHLLNRQGVTRLCYAGSVLRARPDGLAQTREPLQVGAELYGHAGVESDIEIQRLLVQGLRAVGIENVQLDFSHVGIFRALVQGSKLSEAREQSLLAALQNKDKSALTELTDGLDAQARAALLALADLYGGIEVLERAEKTLPAHDEIRRALRELRAAAEKLQGEEVRVSFDLGELRGYHYHSGMVFAAYAEGYAKPLALGGRYDEIGSVFGRARPATGFSLDLRGLATALPPARNGKAILAPYVDDAKLDAKIAELRAAGEVVIADLPGHEAHRAELGCDRVLVKQGDIWAVVAN
ncbi:MAG: ATP phosphoribosyltransferase regulatory subunit [Methylobacillus sp.]|jgi:ATP phosphoribosyltransferase regulatory subunit|nr:ATP phosphoribosyltransferase regulatory subunit [Methylobacillus sp.]